MKRILLLPFISCLSFSGLWAQPLSRANLAEVDTTWPGIRYQLVQVQRIAAGRLLVAIRIAATSNAPAGGTVIGIEVPVPKNVQPDLAHSQDSTPTYTPFSIEAASMTDEATGKTYSTLQPDPAGPHYLPGEVVGSMHPGETKLMTIQFPVPPPPPPVDSGGPPKQAVSFLLPNARGAIHGIAVPPPTSTP